MTTKIYIVFFIMLILSILQVQARRLPVFNYVPAPAPGPAGWMHLWTYGMAPESAPHGMGAPQKQI